MKREELIHCLRSVCAHVPEFANLVVIGSQTIYGIQPNAEAPATVQMSREVDISFLIEPRDVSDALLDSVNAADFWLGEGSHYAETHGFYMEFVEPGVLVLPARWREFVTTIRVPLTDGKTAKFPCLGIEEAAVAKLMRGMDKDKAFVSELIESGSLDRYVLQGLIEDELEFAPGYAPTITEMRRRALEFLRPKG